MKHLEKGRLLVNGACYVDVVCGRRFALHEGHTTDKREEADCGPCLAEPCLGCADLAERVGRLEEHLRAFESTYNGHEHDVRDDCAEPVSRRHEA